MRSVLCGYVVRGSTTAHGFSEARSMDTWSANMSDVDANGHVGCGVRGNGEVVDLNRPGQIGDKDD